MKVTVNIPTEVEVNYRQAIDVLKSTAVEITERSWFSLRHDENNKVYEIFSSVLDGVESSGRDYLKLTEEEHRFVSCIIDLAKAQEDFLNILGE